LVHPNVTLVGVLTAEPLGFEPTIFFPTVSSVVKVSVAPVIACPVALTVKIVDHHRDDESARAGIERHGK
jgi:hypothetical protein